MSQSFLNPEDEIEIQEGSKASEEKLMPTFASNDFLIKYLKSEPLTTSERRVMMLHFYMT